jgi:hypothetical protein
MLRREPGGAVLFLLLAPFSLRWRTISASWERRQSLDRDLLPDQEAVRIWAHRNARFDVLVVDNRVAALGLQAAG